MFVSPCQKSEGDFFKYNFVQIWFRDYFIPHSILMSQDFFFDLFKLKLRGVLTCLLSRNKMVCLKTISSYTMQPKKENEHITPLEEELRTCFFILATFKMHV